MNKAIFYLIEPFINLYLLISIILLFSYSLCLCAEQPPIVKVITVKEKEINLSKEYVGHVEAIRTVCIKPRISGYLKEVRFKEGDFVKKGEILYVIEQEPYKAEVDAANAALEEARAYFFRANQKLKRLKAAKPESISRTSMDAAIADVMQAKAEISQAEARLRKAKIYLGYTIIRAPFSGLVGKSFIKKGNLVTPSAGFLCRIVQIDPIRVVYSISERDINEIRLSLKREFTIKIRLPNGKIYPQYGKIDFVDNHIDPKTGTLAVWALFPNKNRLLLPGMYVTAIPILKMAKKIVTIPQASVLEDKNGKYVLIVNKKKMIEIRRIKVGSMIGTEWSVISGLSVGDKVVVQGILKVKPGQIVNVEK